LISKGAIGVRWARHPWQSAELAPVTDDDLRALINLGLVEMRDHAPVVTPAGLAALE
jgi:hypothetical protein